MKELENELNSELKKVRNHIDRLSLNNRDDHLYYTGMARGLKLALETIKFLEDSRK